MNRQEQISLVTELAEMVSEGIVSDIGRGKVPESWDGFELRLLLAERFAREIVTGYGAARRKAEYNNTVLVNNL